MSLCEICKNCIKCESGYYQLGETKKDEKLTKSIEIIKGLMRFCRCFAQHHTEDIRCKEAEQFLSENSTYERIQKAKYNYTD